MTLDKRNELEQIMSSDEGLRMFYRFAALNPQIEIYDALQIMIARPDAGVCRSFEDWHLRGRTIIGGRHGIRYFDRFRQKRYVFDEKDTQGELKYQREFQPISRILKGLDELNGTDLSKEESGDYEKIRHGVERYLSDYGYLTDDEKRNTLFFEGISYSLFCSTGSMREDIHLQALPYSYEENGRLIKEILLLSSVIREETFNAFRKRRLRAWGNAEPTEQDGEKAAERLEQSEVLTPCEEESENIAEFPTTSQETEEEEWTAEDIEEALSEQDEPLREDESGKQSENIAIPLNSAPKPNPKRSSTTKYTPLYERYFSYQEEYPNAVVLYRMGDFFEVIGEKAVTVSEELDLTLTGRDVGAPGRVPMCGFPYYASDKHLEKLLEKHPVILLEKEGEPKYILSQAEARGEVPVLEMRREDEQSEESAEEEAEIIEEDEKEWGTDEEDYEEYEYEPSMEDESGDEVTPTDADKEKSEKIKGNAKPEQGIKQRKREQPTLFDLFMPKEKTTQDELIDWGVRNGGKERQIEIYEKYQSNPTKSEFAKFIAKQFGWSGMYGSGYGYSSSSKGLKLSFYDTNHSEDEKSTFLKWEDVAVRIADLIDSENYLSEDAKKLYAAMLRRREERGKAKTEHEKLAIIVGQIVEIGKEKNICGKADFYGTELEEAYPFYAENRESVKRMLLDREGILDIEEKHFYTDKTLHLVLDLPDKNGQRKRYNRFTHLRDVGKERLKMFAQSVNREPSGTPWGEVQTCRTIANGIYSVSTAGHGGIMVHKDLAPLILSPEALACGYQDYAFYCYEEDCDEVIPLRELYDKGILEQSNDYFTHYSVNSEREEAEHGYIPFSKATDEEKAAFFKWWNDCINRTLKEYHSDYWTAYEQAAVKDLVDTLVRDGTNLTLEGNWIFYYKDFKGDESFVRSHIKEIKTELVGRVEVADVFSDDECIDIGFYLDYCPNVEVEEDESTQENAETDISAPYEKPQNTDLSAIGFDQRELGGAKARFRGNVEAIRLSRTLEKSNRESTQEEKKTLARFVGWGALPQAFDERNESWKTEYNELKALLSEEEYERAKGSTLNAHYTSKEVIDGIYAALKRFGVKGNNRILEPAMGTGNFFGFMPEEISNGAKLYGVELDSVTGRIASQLYPQAKIQIKGYEETKFPSNYFDLVIGNVPFGGYSVFDSEYAKHNFYIHDYFLAKSIDKLKPNGIMAVITSKGTMDKQNPTVRKYLADRAELLGAIRLPNNAFKQTAGTEVVSDILFFKKRDEMINATKDTEKWIGTGKNGDGFTLNQYFVNHPEMILGTLAIEKGLYASDELTVKSDGRNLSEALLKAVDSLPENIYVNPEFEQDSAPEAEVDFDIRPLCYKAENGKLFMRMGDEMVEQEIPKFPSDAYERIKGMIEIRSQLRHILDIQIKGCSDSELETKQRSLNFRYDSFVRKYGNLSSRVNYRLFKEDGDSALLFACEETDKQTKAIKKADIFFKRTIRPYTAVTSTSDCFEALQICKNENGKVDISYIEDLTKKDYDTVLFELGNAVFRDPEKVDENNPYSGFVSSEEYLSGEVVKKLDLAKRYAETYPSLGFEKNVKALEEVQPTPLTATEISVRLGASWIDKKYYKDFFCELMEAYPRSFYDNHVKLYYNKYDSSWRVDQTPKYKSRTEMKQNKVYGTDRASARRLFEDALNLRDTTIYDIVEVDGTERRVLNKSKTIAAREKQNQIKEKFRKWIFATPERRADLERTYNSLFNKIRLPSYDGSYLRFPEMSPEIKLRPHQVNAIDRIIVSPKSTLLHHVVGSGKTYTMITAAMKLRQYGIAKKPMFAVPNHLVEQWAESWRTIYPNAHILIAEKEDLIKERRQRFVSKVALGDWDGIIIAQSSFAKIPVSKERQITKMREELDMIERSIREQAEHEGKDHGSVKNLMRIKKSREAALKKLMDDTKKDGVLIFENLGVDYLFVDEAHFYKNLFLYSKMNNVAGINSSSASQRASDLKMKCEYLQELHGCDRGIVFGTATPISNSMTEMYTMQRYLQPSTLREIGIDYFDEWAADFGETVTAMEMSPSGQGFRTRTRFAKFVNLPENLKLYRSFSDVQTSEQVKLPVPEVERQMIKLKPSDRILEYAQEIAARAERIYNGSVDPHEDNMLKVTSDGKKLALDVRCFDRSAEPEEESKVNMCAVKVKEIWEQSKATRGTQLVFCDLSTPKKAFSDYEYGKDFDVYNELKYKLVKFGIPEREIAFIHEAKTDKEKQDLFHAVNSGEVRVFIGSTEKCGAGMNVQQRLIALHHLDTPYRPSDMEQREGRIIRQGNENPKVQIFTYVMERTFDSYSYQILENKQRFISQINRGDITIREAEDIDEATLSYAQIKAITSGNPKILRKMQVDEDIAKLKILESEYLKNLYRLQDLSKIVLPEKIRKQELYLSRLRSDMEMIKAKKGDGFSISLFGQVYTEKSDCAEVLRKAINGDAEKPFGEFCGFILQMKPMSFFDNTRYMILSGNGQYELELGPSEMGNFTRLENFISSFPEREVRASEQLELLKKDLRIAEEQAQAPFEKADELSTLQAEQLKLNEELSLEKKEEIILDPETKKGEEEMENENDDMEELMTDEVNFTGLPTGNQSDFERIGKSPDFDKFLDEGLAEITWLNGKLSGFTEDEIHDLAYDLKPHYETAPYAPKDPEMFDDWYDTFVEELLEKRLMERSGNYSETPFKQRTKQGFEVITTYDNGERVFAIIHRENADLDDYIIGCGYDEKTGEWGQGYYGYKNYQKAKSALDSICGVTNKSEELDYKQLVRDSVEQEYQKFYQEESKKSNEDLITRDNYKINFFNALSDFLGDDDPDDLKDRDFEALYEDTPEILESLYDSFMGSEYASINTSSDILEMIINYNDKYHEDIVEDRYEHDKNNAYENIKLIGKDEEGTAYFLFRHKLTSNGFEKVKDEADRFVIASPNSFIPEVILKENNIVFLKLEKDVESDKTLTIEQMKGAINAQEMVVPLNRDTFDEAREKGETAQYRRSVRENLRCRDEIAEAIKNNFDGEYLNKGFENELIKKYGLERIVYLCANTIMEHDWDARFSKENKEWAKGIALLPETFNNKTSSIEAHPYVLNGFIDRVRKIKEKQEETKMPEQGNSENKRTWLTFKVSANALVRTYENSSFMRMPQDNEELKDYTYNIFNNRMKESTMEEPKKEPCFEVRIGSDEEVRLMSRDGDEKKITAAEFIKLVGGKRADSYRRNGSEKIEFEIPKEAILQNRESYYILSTPTNSKYKGRTFTLPSGAVEETETGYKVSLFKNFRANIRWGDSEVKASAEELKALCGSTSAADYVRKPSPMDDYRTQEGNIVFELNERAIIAEYDRSVLVKMPKGEYSGYTCYIPKKFVLMEEGEMPQVILPEDYNILLKDRVNNRETSVSAPEFAAAHKDKTERAYLGYFVKPSEESVRALEETEANLRENLPDEMLNRPNWVAVRTRVNPKTQRLDKFLIDVHTDEFAKSDDPSTWTDFDSAVEYAKNNGCIALAYALDGKDNIVCIDVDDCIDEKEVCSDTAFDCMENTRGTYCERSVSKKGLHFLGKSEGIPSLKVYSRDGEMELYQKGHFITLTGDVSGSNEIKSFDTPQMKSFLEERFDRHDEMKGIGKGVEGLSTESDKEILDMAMNAYNGETFKAYYNGEDLRNNHSNSDMAFMNMLAFWCRHDIDQMQRIFATSGLYRADKSPEYYEHTARKAIKTTPMRTLKREPTPYKPANSGGNSKV